MSGERNFGRAFHPQAMARALPADEERTARQVHLHVLVQPSIENARGGRGACAGTAGLRFAHAAFEHAQAQMVAADDLEGWVAAILDFSRSGERTRQMELLQNWRRPTWASHFRRVLAAMANGLG
jgi:hypothetical protein